MEPKSTILYMFHVSHIGGGSLCLLNIVKELDKDKFSPIVLLKDRGPLCEELERIGATVILEPSISPVPYNRSLLKINSIKQVFAVLLSLKKVKYWIKKTNPDIVHINTMMMYPYSIISKKLKKKVVIHVRENWPMQENTFQFNFARRIIAKYSHRIIAINKSSSNIINLPRKTEIIYDWIDFKGREEFIDLQNIFGKNHRNLKIYLFLGGVQKLKGALEVVTAFHENLRDENVRLLVVGCESELIDLKGFKGIAKNFFHIFNYFTYSDQIKKIIQSNDNIRCIPATNQVKSLIEQTYCTIAYPTRPHAILPVAESIYLGKPVISALTPEALEYSINGTAAKLFPINNYNMFLEALEYSYNNNEEMVNNARNGMGQIRQIFSANKNSSKLNNLYKNLVKNV